MEKKIKLQIKNRFTGSVLFEYEKEDNTVKDTVIEAVKSGADLGGADLGGAYLRGADLGGADLRGAYLGGAKNIPYYPMACPSHGAFVGWKKVGKYIIKLQIPEDAKRCSSTGIKCRCDKAIVLEITHKDTGENIQEIENNAYSPAISYKVGETVFPDSFDENRWNECSHGIHFFINKQDAIDY